MLFEEEGEEEKAAESLKRFTSNNDSTGKSIYVIFYTPDAELAESEPFLDEMSWYTKVSRQFSHNLNVMNSSWTTKTLEWSPQTGNIRLTDQIYTIAVENWTENSPLDVSGGGCGGITNILRCGSLYNLSPIVATNTEDESYGLSQEGERKSNHISNVSSVNHDLLYLGEEFTTLEEPATGRSRGDNKKRGLSKSVIVGRGGGGISTVTVGSHVVKWTSVEGDVQCYRPFYSHVELMFGDYVTYSIRWGDTLSKVKKTYRSNCNVYTTLKLTLQPETYSTLKKYCEQCLKSQIKFNYFGLYYNFLAPDFVRQRTCKNGNSYWSSDVVFCSEFITRLFCMIGIFKDKTNLWPGPPTHNEKSHIIERRTLDDSLKECMTPQGEILVDPATTSPNLLFLYLQMKKCLFQTTISDGNDMWPFCGEPRAYIMNSFLPKR